MTAVAPDPFTLAADAFTPRERTLADEEFPSPGALAMTLDPANNLNPPHLQLLDDKLVAAAAGDIDRLLITMPPQEGKSTRAVRYFVLWLLKHNPELRIAIVSYEYEAAARWGRAIRDDIANNPELGIRVREDVKAAGRWQVLGHRGSVYCTGWQGSLTGQPVDVLIMDDLVKGPKEADSPTYRNDQWDFWLATARARLGAKPIVVAIMTRWHPDDIGGRWIREEGRVDTGGRWNVVTIPAQAEEHDPIGREAGEWLRSARGRSVEQWQQLQAETPPRWWLAQYQGRPAAPEGAVWRREWIEENRVPADQVPELMHRLVVVDPSGSSGKGAAETGIVVLALGTDGDVYVFDDYSLRATAAVRARRVCEAAVDYQVDEIVIEEDFGGDNNELAIRSAWSAFARGGMGGRRLFRVPEIRSMRARGEGSKRTRAEVAAGFYQQGRVHHVTGRDDGRLAGLEDQQLTWSGEGASPDRIDALAHGVRELIGAKVAMVPATRGARLVGRR